jgi:hypothetical protein
MNSLQVDVYRHRPRNQRIRVTSQDFISAKSVYAQSRDTTRVKPRGPDDRAPCALSLKRVKVGRFPAIFRTSGRAYFQFYRDGKTVEGRQLLYGPGIRYESGQFPFQTDKELWLPIRTGSDDRYSGLLADLTSVADCSAEEVRVRPYGRLSLGMFADNGELLNVFDLSEALATPNQEFVLVGESKEKASLTVEVLAQPLRIVRFSHVGNILTWKVSGAFSDILLQGLDQDSTEELNSSRSPEDTYDISGDRKFLSYALQVLDQNLNVAREKQISNK